MLQIGELARLAGVTPRTIRHYHHCGLMPEPSRTEGGYRTYGARALSRLVQIRRLSALGLGLAEIADALDSRSGPDMREVLRELDADLAAREAEIRQRRAVVARLLEHGDDPTLSPELAEMIRDLGLPDDEVDALRAAELALPEVIDQYRDGYTPDPDGRALGELIADLAGAEADDPRVAQTGHRMREILDRMVAARPDADDTMPSPEAFQFGRMLVADLSPGQRRAWQVAAQEAVQRQEAAD